MSSRVFKVKCVYVKWQKPFFQSKAGEGSTRRAPACTQALQHRLLRWVQRAVHGSCCCKRAEQGTKELGAQQQRCPGQHRVRSLTSQVHVPFCSTPVILNCLTLWRHSNLGCFETQGPARYLKHGFVLKRMQAASPSPALRLCGCTRGYRRAVPQPLRAFPLPPGSDKMRSQPLNVPVLRKGTLEIASEIKEGIYPHDCSAEKAISIVC